MLGKLREYLKVTKKDWNYITPTEFYELQQKNKKNNKKNDFQLIDLRKKSDYDAGHIKGAINIFWRDILDDKNLKKLSKNKKIFIVCYVGHSSSQTMTLLKLLGYDVVSIKYGMGVSPVKGVPVAGWLSFNYPITKSRDCGK